MSFGLDYVSGPPIPDMKAAGVTFVCRYLSSVNNLTKVKLLSPVEATALSQAGIALVSNYEWYANRALEGRTSGMQDAQMAASQHATCGGSVDRPIYFSVDVDVAGSQALLEYFRGISDVIGLRRTGAYGSYRVLQYLFNAGAITWGWQTYAWSGGQWEPRAHIQQYQNGVIMAGHSVDYNRSIKSDFGQWFSQAPGGEQPMVTPMTPGGENAVFVDNVTQLEGGETEDACVAFSASNIWHSVAPGKPNPYSAEDIDVMADSWYTRLTGSINNSNGLSEGQLHTMLDGIGLEYEPILLSHTSEDDNTLRAALSARKLVVVCAAESSFFDLEIGRPPYSWNTKPFNHAIVASGLITSGPWKGNVWVRDTVAVSGGYPPSTKRPYDIGKMQYVSLTAIVPAWLKGKAVITMSGLPTGAKDDGKVITFSNAHVMKLGFRAKYLQMASAGLIPHDDEPLEDEHDANPVEQSNAAYWGGPGRAQTTRYFHFGYSVLRGVQATYIGQELLWYQTQLAALQKQIANGPAALVGTLPPAIEADIKSMVAAFDQLRKDAKL